MQIAITGANSSVGLALLSHICGTPDLEAIAGVRSRGAFASLPTGPSIHARVIDYANPADLADALRGASCVVHLAGILIESKTSKYASANVDATRAVCEAARSAGVGQVIFISVVGADPASGNAYFRSKGEAERLVEHSGIPATIIRTPILLGAGTAGADSILWATSRPRTRLLGGGYYTMHPLDVDDLCRAILNASRQAAAGSRVVELYGPEPILYRDLVQRVARRSGREISIGSVPIWFARLGAAITSTIKGGGFSPTVIDVITLDEKPGPNGAGELGIDLTSLDQTLEKMCKSGNEAK